MSPHKLNLTHLVKAASKWMQFSESYTEQYTCVCMSVGSKMGLSVV